MIALALAGCAAGPSDETVIDEVRVVAVVVEPPEAAPGAPVTVTVEVADPAATGVEAVAWTCTDMGDGCLEHADADLGAATGPVSDGRLVATRTVSAALAGVVADGVTVLPLPLWALACEPGLCPVFDDLGADAPAAEAFLADPFAGMEALPMGGTSLALALASVSTRAEPLAHPTLSVATPPATATLGEAVEIEVATDGATAYGYTTAGGFDRTEYAVTDGVATLTWYAPEEAGEATLWIVVNGAEGGAATWRGVVTAD